MNGYVSGQSPCLNVVLLSQGQQLNIEFFVDTGFEGALTLPVQAVAALNLSFYQRISANLADDSNCMVDVYTATILWHGQPLNVAVLAMGQRPLLGTSLLNGNDLHIHFEDGGLLTLHLFQSGYTPSLIGRWRVFTSNPSIRKWEYNRLYSTSLYTRTRRYKPVTSSARQSATAS